MIQEELLLGIIYTFEQQEKNFQITERNANQPRERPLNADTFFTEFTIDETDASILLDLR